jgi:zinc transport system permease protein
VSDDTSLRAFFAGWELFQSSVLAGTVAGATLGTLGVYVVLRRMVFLGAALSQAAGLGVALTFYVHVILDWHAISPTLGAMLTTLATAGILFLDQSPQGARRDSALGLAYLMGAAGTLAVGTRIVEEIQDIHSILFGSAVAVAPGDFVALCVLGVLVLGLHAWWMRGFVLASFDRDGAQVRGLPVRLLDAALIGTLAIATSVCTRVLGALPVLAFTVLPAMAAVRLAANVQRALVIAGMFGALAGCSGYVVAFLARLPVGAAQALVSGGLVGVAILVSHLRPR